MRLRDIRTNRDGFLRVLTRGRSALLPLPGAQIGDECPGFGTLGIGQSVVRINSNRLIEKTDGRAIVFEISSREIKVALKIRVVRIRVFGRSTRGGRIISAE